MNCLCGIYPLLITLKELNMTKLLITKVLRVCYIDWLKFIPYQLYSYLVLGAFNTIFNILIFVGIYKGIEANAFALEVAMASSFVISVFIGFWLNKNFTFKEEENSNQHVKYQFAKYLLISLLAQLLDYLLTKSQVLVFNVDPVIAYLITTFLVLAGTYLGQRYFTFKRSADL